MRRSRSRGARLWGRLGFDGGELQELTPAQATALLRIFQADTQGLVPAPGTPTGLYLKDDGTWDTPAGGGGGDTVTVNGSAVTDVDLDNATPAAAAGGLNVTWQTSGSGPANVSAYIGASTLLDVLGSTRGSILYRGASGWAVATPGTSTHVWTSNGAGADPSWQAAPGGGVSDGDKGDVTVSSSGSVWTIDAGAVTYAKLQDISATQRVLGRNSGGSGDAEEVTASQVLDWRTSTQGQVLYRGASTWDGLAVGTAGQVLTTGGAAANPSWGTLITAGTYASAPAGALGAMHMVDETGIIRRHDGSGWVDYLSGVGKLWAPPTTGWTKAASSHASAAQTAVDGHLRIDLPVAGATARSEWYRAEPAATYEIEIVVRAMSVGNAATTQVLVLGGFYATGSTRAMFMYVRGDGLLIVQKDNPLGTFSSTARSTTLIQSANVYWFAKIVRDGSNLYFYVSHDREVWIEVFSEAVGTFITPDRVIGPGLHLAGGNARGAYADLLSWRVI
jgi:hypothetical protein